MKGKQEQKVVCKSSLMLQSSAIHPFTLFGFPSSMQVGERKGVCVHVCLKAHTQHTLTSKHRRTRTDTCPHKDSRPTGAETHSTCRVQQVILYPHSQAFMAEGRWHCVTRSPSLSPEFTAGQLRGVRGSDALDLHDVEVEVRQHLR